LDCVERAFCFVGRLAAVAFFVAFFAAFVGRDLTDAARAVL
jgi:hypothetical protein